MSIVFYGYSDDLLEVEGAGLSEEYETPATVRLQSPDGHSLLVHACFGDNGWEITVGNDAKNTERGYPSWAMAFGQRADHDGDPAVEIATPEGTVVTQVP